jgi:hypothetical protein
MKYLALTVGLVGAAVVPIAPPVATASAGSTPASGRHALPYAIDAERALQAAVDQGHQPWRLDPVAV